MSSTKPPVSVWLSVIGTLLALLVTTAWAQPPVHQFIGNWKQFEAPISAGTNLATTPYCGPGVSPGYEITGAKDIFRKIFGIYLRIVARHD